MSVAKLVVCTVLCVCFSLCAQAQTTSLAVHPIHDTGLDTLTSHFLQQELDRLLSPAEIKLLWQYPERAGIKPEQTDRLIVGTFEGNCSASTIPWFSGVSPNGKVLAETSVSDGRILPYFTVDCARVIRTLAPTLQPLSLPARNALLGRALARVIGHEIYHILAGTPDHDDAGVAKAQLSLRELTATRFDLSPASLRRIRGSHPSEPPAVPMAGLAVRGSED